MRRLIVTADDFGRSRPVNEAVERAAREGILSAASLMVGAPEAADAVARARHLPRLGVGLHIVLVDGVPVLPPSRIPDLVDGEGRFPRALGAAGLRFFFRPGVRAQLAAEIRAQFETFRSTGLELDHVNGHNHMHLHPTVLGLILAIGRDYGLRAVRLPREPLGPLIASGQATYLRQGPASLGLAPWLALMRARLRRARIRHNDWLFGMARTGQMTESVLLDLIEALPGGVSELYFHPAAGSGEPADPISGYDQEGEFRALLSSKVRGAIRRAGFEPVAFRDLA
jgi:hopanoid biosynthesis associated protein HpnK